MTDAEGVKDSLYHSVVDGNRHGVAHLTRDALDAGLKADELLYDALIPALEEVGALFEQGEFFVPEMLTGARAMKTGLAILRPILAQAGAKPLATAVLLTVAGDVHDIGKDLVRIMWEGAGFHVVDLGVDVTPAAMLEAVRDHRPFILGFSAFLTTTMPMFKANVELLTEAGLREHVKILVGGAPVTEEYARYVGADGYAAEASTATRLALDFVRNPDKPSYLSASAPEPHEVIERTKTFTSPAPMQRQRRPSFRPSMKPRERVLAVLRRDEPDRVPHFEWEHSVRTIRSLAGSDNYHDLIEELDLDAVMVAPMYRSQSIGGGLIADEWGAIRRRAADNTALPVDDRAPISSHADLERWQPPDPDDPLRYSQIKEAVSRFGGERAIFLQLRDVWSGPRDYIGYAQLFINLKENPALVEGVVEKCVDHYIRVVERAAEYGVDVVMSGDDVADNRGPMFSPTLWQTLFIPHYRRLVDAIHRAGLYHWKHGDGNMYPLLDSIIDAGSDGIDPIDPLGGMELSVVKAEYGNKVAIKGNVDQTRLLMTGPPEEVIEAVKSCIREAGVGGGYVCSSSNCIHEGVDPGLYRTMVEAIHSFGRYPLDFEMLKPSPAVRP